MLEQCCQALRSCDDHWSLTSTFVVMLKAAQLWINVAKQQALIPTIDI